MDPFALTPAALQEPWRLWTGHLVHYGWGHALANTVALGAPWVLVPRGERLRLAWILVLLAPLLSLLLLPSLPAGAAYRGASGLACALWAFVGLRLAGQPASRRSGALLLLGLVLKLGLEVALGSGLLAAPGGWHSLPAAHLWGGLLGAGLALPGQPFPHSGWIGWPKRYAGLPFSTAKGRACQTMPTPRRG